MSVIKGEIVKMRAHDAIEGVLYFVSIFFAPQFGLN